jgi:amidase
MRELLWRSATELRELIKTGEVSAKELVGAALDAISQDAGDVNAFAFVDAEGALAAAEGVTASDARPFAGVPIAVKDISPVAGMPLTGASELFGDYLAHEDSHTVRRLRQAGFIIVGKTTLSEFGVVPAAESRRFGVTRNPWDLSRTPGGSSGGSAAAVASGMVPLAHGNDGGGSIRVPAACCGLVGLKPTRGRISRGPEAGEDFFVQDGVLTHSVADTAAVLDVLAGPEPGDSTWLARPAQPFALGLTQPQGRKWIAMTTAGPIAGELEAESERAVRETGQVLRDLGHEVFELSPSWGAEFADLLGPTLGPRLAASMTEAARLSGREPTEESLEPLSWLIYSGVRGLSTTDHLAAMAALQRLTRRFIENWDFDLLLLPTIGPRPLPVGALDPSAPDVGQTLERARAFTRFASFFNATGQPAISLPLFAGPDGLPTAVQLVGPPAREATLLTVASQLEEALPWASRRPTLTDAHASLRTDEAALLAPD